MALLYNGQVTQVLSLAFPTVEMQQAGFRAARDLLAENKSSIKEAALIANITRSGAEPGSVIIALFETHKQRTVKMFQPGNGNTLSEIQLASKPLAGLSLGLTNSEPDFGAMYR
jgi:hypothetical protein